GRANSLLQIFIQSLVQATIEALTLRGVMMAFDFLKTIFSPKSALLPGEDDLPGGDPIFKRQGIAPTPGTTSIVNVMVKSEPQTVYVEGQISGRTIRLSQKRET